MERQPIKYALIMLQMLSIAMSIACSSAKKLDDNNAKDLAEAYLGARNLSMPTHLTREPLPHSLVDGSKIIPTSEKERIGHDLITQKFILVGTETRTYPRVSGRFSAATRDGEAGYELQMAPDSNALNGTYFYGRQSNPLNGTSRPDGRIDLQSASQIPRYGRSDTAWAKNTANYEEQGQMASLHITHQEWGVPTLPDNLAGKASGEKITVNWYTYTPSADLLSKLTTVDGQNYLAIGKARVVNVSGLRLNTETEAQADITWKMQLSELGASSRPKRATLQAVAELSLARSRIPRGSWIESN